jgi:hypothetical protein
MTDHRHPSYLELDRLALGPAGESEARLQGCEQCLRYVGEQRRPLPVPEWARAAAQRKPWLPRLLPWGAALAACAGALALVVLTRPPVPDDAREKGGPRVQLFVKRDGAVSRWDGRSAVRAGDSIMLEVSSPEDCTVQVESISGAPEELYSGPVQRGRRTLLPRSFRVDDAPGAERLRVRFRGKHPSSIELDLPKGKSP